MPNKRDPLNRALAIVLVLDVLAVLIVWWAGR